MNYEQKYKEALERAKKVLFDKETTNHNVAEFIFPELAESEDERIRKKMIEHFKSKTKDTWCNMPVKDILDWLEKQKEQKFNIELIQQSWYMEGYHDREFGKEPKWIIKTGEGGPKHELNPKYGEYIKKEQKPISFNEPYSPDDYEVVMGENTTSLKKKEQKPTESISQLTVQGKGVYKICPRCKERMVRDDSMVYTSMPPQYRYECPKCGESECDTVMYDNPEMDEQKPAEWSEEDEKNCNRIIRFLEPHKTFFPTKEQKEEMQNWIKNRLKSLRPQPKQEWSEEDENARQNLIAHFEGKVLRLSDEAKKEAVDWLKSLRKPEYCENCKLKKSVQGWKPSIEQIYSLGAVIKGSGDNAVGSVGYNLKSLYEDLKKL